MMNVEKEQKYLSAFTRGLIALLMLTGFALDGCQGADGFFIVATLLWIYQPFIVRTESTILRSLQQFSR